jgi:hypothetical protein
MRRIGIPLATLVIVAALAAPVVAGTTASVGGGAGWVSTGITVESGQRLAIQAKGSVHTASIPEFHVPGVFKSASGPDGQVGAALCGDVTRTFSKEVLAQTGACALDTAYFGELIGRVGRKTFRIGAASEIVVPASGTLELAANDLTLTYWDNTGAFTVVFR